MASCRSYTGMFVPATKQTENIAAGVESSALCLTGCCGVLCSLSYRLLWSPLRLLLLQKLQTCHGNVVAVCRLLLQPGLSQSDLARSINTFPRQSLCLICANILDQISGPVLPCPSRAMVMVDWMVRIPLLLQGTQDHSPKKENLTSNNLLHLQASHLQSRSKRRTQNEGGACVGPSPLQLSWAPLKTMNAQEPSFWGKQV